MATGCSPVTITIDGIRQSVLDMHLRMPFHFGNTTLIDLPHLFVRLTLDHDGSVREGIAAEALSPLWFVKDPAVTYETAFEMMVETIEAATGFATGIEAETPFDFWRRLYERQEAWTDEAYPPLLRGFATTLVERAVIDAFCRATDTNFARAVRRNTLGIDLGWVHEELAGYAPTDLLPPKERRTVAVRHTVGFTDPLSQEELDTTERLNDGLPQTLSEYVARDGLHWFKIKLSGDVEADAARLAGIEAVLEDADIPEYAFTLDANEQYGDAASFRRDWRVLREHAGDFFDHLHYVEQPLARGDALTEDTREIFTNWDDRPSLIIDESDAELRSLERALDCGYDGTSHKNCKGVFKGIANACLIEHRNRNRSRDGEYLLSGEDLTTTGPVGLQQDLAVMATLGCAHVERNGHHYFRGLEMLPKEMQEAVSAAHGDLYRRHERGFPAVEVSDGQIRLKSVVDAPFGTPYLPEIGRFTPLSEYDAPI